MAERLPEWGAALVHLALRSVGPAVQREADKQIAILVASARTARAR